MKYTLKYNELCNLLRDTGNINILSDFFVQLQLVRKLDKNMISNQLDNIPIDKPNWLSLVTKTDIRNIIVFLMWSEFATVIHAKESYYNEDSSLGIHIEDLGVYLETKYYIDQIKKLQSSIYETNALSYTEWIRNMVDTVGLVETIEALMP